MATVSPKRATIDDLLRTEGKADATQIAADRADSQSLAAKKWAKFGPIIAIVQTILTILYHVLTAKP